MNGLKRNVGMLLVILIGIVSPMTTYATVTDVNYTDVPDVNYEKADILATLDGQLQEIGLSFEILVKTGIDFKNLNYQPKSTSNNLVKSASKNVEPKSTIDFPQVKRLAKKTYGTTPTNDQLMHTFMLYYVDVFDQDRNAGKIGENLPSKYFPEYITENDTSAYTAFLNASAGRKWANLALSSFGSAKGLYDTVPTVANMPLEELKSKVSSVGGTVEVGKLLYDTFNVGKDIKTFTEDFQSRPHFQSPEDFMIAINETVDNRGDMNKASKDVVKSMFDSVLDKTFALVAGANPAGLVAISTMYEASLAPLYLSIYDQAAINTLGYTRRTRLGLREYYSWGM